MNDPNYKELYRTNEARNKAYTAIPTVSEFEIGQINDILVIPRGLWQKTQILFPFQPRVSLEEATKKVMGIESGDTLYDLKRRRGRQRVEFSSDKFNDESPEMLVLRLRENTIEDNPEKQMRNIVALRYQAVRNNGVNQYGISWTNDPDYDNDPDNYLGICYVQTMAGMDKDTYRHATQVLGARPHEFIVAQFLARVAPILDARPQTKVVLHESDLHSRKTIRDRFFDKNWRLNPEKERVRQILGEDNTWLDQESIIQRQKKTA